ncbi:MAG: hypothetical protein H6Q86_887 [candidate division NC10 bacterium]|jgi:hypothetical protein|nr:hypothetical protein [candidate division NC10 bacterium]
MEKRQWFVRWTNKDGYDDYDFVVGAKAEIEAIVDRLERYGYSGVSAYPLDTMKYDADGFNQYLDEIEVPR